MADGSVIIDTKMNNDALEKGFERLKTDCESLGITCEKAGDKIKAAFADYDVSANIQNAVSKLEQAQIKLQTATDYFNDAVAMDDDKSAEAWARKREAAYTQVENAQRRLTQVIAAEANKQAREEEKAQVKATKAAEREAAKKKKAQDKAYKDATKGARQFATRFSRILSGALVFNALSAGLRQLTSYFGTALKKNSEFASSFAQLKGAFLTAVQPIYELLLPAMIALVDMLTKVMQGASRLASMLTGKSTAEMAKNAKALYDQANATEAVGDAAEKAKKQVAGFDQITKLNSSDESTSSNTSSIAANFEQAEVPGIELDKIITYTSGALLALGVILTFTGANIPLGLGLMAIGAVGLATEITENWGCMDEEVGKAIHVVLGTLAAGGLVIGAILAFTGANIPLGIGLMLLGAAALGSEVAINWGSIKDFIENNINEIVLLVSGALLAVGAILAFTGVNLPLGIALIAAGALGLVTLANINQEAIVKALQGTLGKIIAVVSGALLAIGAILVFTGVNLPLGIGLIAAGALGLGAMANLNWDSIVTALRGTVGKIVAVVSTALLALGAILAFTGVGIPLGIGLIAVGAAGLATTMAVNWDTIKQKIKSVFAGILAIISGASLVLGVLLCLTGAGLGLGLALIFAGLAGTKKAWSLSDNPVTRFVKNLANGVIGIINSIAEAINDLFHIKFDGLKIGGVQIIPSFDTQLLRLPTIPKLAQGAVLPANQPFLAMVGDQKHGTNVEAPLSTIQEAVAEVMGDMLPAMVAGFEALLEENQRLRAVVESIDIGDSTIGQAANRYNQRIAIIRG